MLRVLRADRTPDANQNVTEKGATAAAAGSGAAAVADLVDAAGAVVDRRLDVAVGGCVAEAHDHGLNLKLAFNAAWVKP